MTRERVGNLLFYLGLAAAIVVSLAAPDANLAIAAALGAMAVGSLLGSPVGSPRPKPPKRIGHASEIADFPDVLGRMLQGDLIVLAPHPKTHPRQLPDENNLFIVGSMLTGTNARTVVSLATGETFALGPNRRCCRVDVQLEVRTAAGR